jgi:pimeloyl-ACP methyl ester carboxylesterase
MTTRDEALELAVDDQRLAATLVAPAPAMPGLLFVHGWGGSQEQYLARARAIATLGCVCLTFDLRGHARSEPQHHDVTREDSLRDVVAAYDLLAGQRAVDGAAIAVVGSSYGGYLAAILTSLRPVRWLGLRAPALYRDEDWSVPKRELDRSVLAAYRRLPVRAEENRALGACAAFAGDVLVVESEHDDVVPHPTIASYLAAFRQARSLTHRVIEGADHGLDEEVHQQAYTALLVRWASEMVLGARADGASQASPERPRDDRPTPVEPGEEVLDEAVRPG